MNERKITSSTESTRSLGKYYLVSGVPLFRFLNPADRSFVANRCRLDEYNSEELIYRAGEPCDFLYILVSGSVTLEHSAPNGDYAESRGNHHDVLRKGDYFGIVSILTDTPHRHTARARTDARILKIERGQLDNILKRIPRLSLHFSSVLARRLLHQRNTIAYRTVCLGVLPASNHNAYLEYIKDLAENLRRVTGKKICVLHINTERMQLSSNRFHCRQIDVNSVAEARNIFDRLPESYHYLIIHLPAECTDINCAILEHCDELHLPSSAGPGEHRRAVVLQKQIQDRCGNLPAQIRRRFRLHTDDYQRTQFMHRLIRNITGQQLGLALGGGAALGLAQPGILQVLEERNVPVDVVAGTSVGALMGALWCAGNSAFEMRNLFSRYSSLIKTLKLIDFKVPGVSLIGGKHIRARLYEILEDRSFADVRIPLRVVACDIDTLEEVVIQRGRLVDAIMASIAIPGILPPFRRAHRRLVDGGIVNPLPINVLSREGVSKIIAVNSMPSPEEMQKAAHPADNVFKILMHSFYSMEYRIGKHSTQEADVVLNPIPPDSAWFEFYRSEEYANFGREQMLKMWPEIEQLIES
ncbi:MAG: patatin-like phospholipase family protein [Leptospiraceae bacterium]|nr:patatin-like phospholipase family protein [Leptospiraceae bacterium]